MTTYETIMSFKSVTQSTKPVQNLTLHGNDNKSILLANRGRNGLITTRETYLSKVDYETLI